MQCKWQQTVMYVFPPKEAVEGAVHEAMAGARREDSEEVRDVSLRSCVHVRVRLMRVDCWHVCSSYSFEVGAGSQRWVSR